MKLPLIILIIPFSIWPATRTVSAVRIIGNTERSDTCTISASSTALHCSGGLFTQADANHKIPMRVVGAGTSGADLVTYVSSYTGASDVTIGNAAATGVTSMSATYGIEFFGSAAEIDIVGISPGGTYNFGLGSSNSPSTYTPVFTITSPGYDASASLGTITRTVYATRYIRYAYPNQGAGYPSVTTPDESNIGGTLTIRVSLSDFVYSADTLSVSIPAGFYVSGSDSNGAANISITNNSINTYAITAPFGRIISPVQYDRITGAFTLEAALFSRFARDGKPLAAVKLSCSDGTHTSGPYVVNNLTISTSAGDQAPVLVYAASIDPTTLTQGAVITCDAKAYPWVGDATSVYDTASTSGYATYDARRAGIVLLNDRTGSYSKGVVVVDAVNGHNSTATTWVYASQALAEAAYAGDHTISYQDIGLAEAAIKAYNNANGHNDPGGGIVLLSGLGYSPIGTIPSYLGDQTTWLTVTHLSTLTRAQAGINSTTTQNGIQSQKVKWSDITINGSGLAFWAGGSNFELWFDNNSINESTDSFISYTAGYATRNTVAAFGNNAFSNVGNGPAWKLVRGNIGPAVSSSGGPGIFGHPYALIGNLNFVPQTVNVGFALPLCDNGIVAYNKVYGSTANNPAWLWYTTTTSIGFALVQNLIEIKTSFMELMDEQGPTTYPSNNIIVWNNTVVGDRYNIAYDWLWTSGTGPIGAPVLHTNYSVVGNIADGWNTKHDPESINPTAVKGWPFSYGVGQYGNQKRHTVTVIGDFLGIYSFTEGGFSFTDCQATNYNSNGCLAGMNGNYHLRPFSSAINLIPAHGAVLPYDMDGMPRNITIPGAAGVYEYGLPTTCPDPSIGVTTCYYIANGGNDSSAGTKVAPWAHLPSMRTWTGSHTPVAGEGFILRGGDTWTIADLGFQWTVSGTLSNRIYIGVDQSWYSGGSWARPVWTCGGADCYTASGLPNMLQILANYVSVDNIEFTGLYLGSGTTHDVGAVSLAGLYDEVSNCYGHGWGHHSTSTGNVYNFSTYIGGGSLAVLGSSIHDNVVDGSDTAMDDGFGIDNGQYIYNNVVRYAFTAIQGKSDYIFNNLIEHVDFTAYNGAHCNELYHKGPIDTVANLVRINNNVIRNNTAAGCVVAFIQNLVTCPSCVAYVYDNVISATSGSDPFIAAGQSTAFGTVYVYGNTVAAGLTRSCMGNGNSSPLIGTVSFDNNHCITESGSVCLSGGSITCINGGHNLLQTSAQAAVNYNGSSGYAYAPKSINAQGVASGANLSSLISQIGATFGIDTTYAVEYNMVSHSVIQPQRATIPHPEATAWDVGAYQFYNSASVIRRRLIQ